LISALKPEEKIAISRISSLVLINALTFQEILSQHETRVLSLSQVVAETYPIEILRDHWQFILSQINYYPIFHLAREVLLNLSASPEITRGIRDLAEAAQRIVANRAALRHDLMGRVYHRLLADRKFLATYYTGIPAAVMLLKLALRPDAWATEWDNLDQLRAFRIADLACGTGTLLMAAADTVTDNYIASRASKGQAISIPDIHAALAEDILYGYDVLASAVHLTASTLALRAPDAVFKGMNLFSLPLGADAYSCHLGSIEFLRSKDTSLGLPGFGAPIAQVNSHGADSATMASLPELDLCVMNPPFTRSVGGNLLFVSSPKKEREQLQKELKKLVRNGNVPASITAGLGSVFVAIADRYIKPDGRIALVLPKAVLSGVAWDRTRELLRRNYRVEYIVASHDPLRWNFSESTDLSEVLLVARKVANGEPEQEQSSPVVGVNLWRNPTTSFDALAVVSRVLQAAPPDIAKGQGALEVGVGKQKTGEAVSIPWDTLKDQYLWLLPCAFAQSDLIRAAYYLMQHRLWIPGQKSLTPIPLSPLGELADLGPDRRDIHDAFKETETRTAFPALWGHRADSVYTMAQKPNRPAFASS